MDPLWILLFGILVVVGGILRLRLNAFFALVLGAFVVAALTPSSTLERFALDKKMSPDAARKFASKPLGERVAEEFGQTAGKIGILIAMAAVVGKCLMESGGADRIVRSTLRVLGESRAPFAFLISGYLLGIPIFFDTVFLLMIPLGKAMWLRTRRDYLLYVLTIVAGASMTHSLVPPTPGPLFVAAELKVDLGVMILGGVVVGIFTSAAGCAFAFWVNRKNPIPVRESSQGSIEALEALARRDDRELPPLWMALLPILIPVVLIGGQAVFGTAAGSGGTVLSQQFQSFFRALGNPNVALSIACAVAFWMLARQRKQSLGQLASDAQTALGEGGVIILITAAGGAFGGMLQQSGIGLRIQELSASYQIAVLPLAFMVTALVRIAQGSATVAMITAVGMFGGMSAPEQLGFHPVYLALAIGCGSKPLPWMNDSGFWVVCKTSGLTENEALRSYTPMITLMGFVGLGVTMVLARFFPLN